MKALLTTSIHIMRWSWSVCAEIQWFQLRPGLILIYFSDIHVLCTGLYLSKLNWGVKKFLKSEDPFSFLVQNRTKFFRSPQKFLRTFFFFSFFRPNSKQWSISWTRGSRNCIKKWGPFFFFSPIRNKILQLPSKIFEDLFILNFF